MRIKQADVQPIIGIESNAATGETVHVLNLHIQAKGIDPKDFENMTGRYDVIFKKAPLPPGPKKYVVDHFTWRVFTVMLMIVAYITDGYMMAGWVFLGMVGLLGLVYLIAWMQNKTGGKF